MLKFILRHIYFIIFFETNFEKIKNEIKDIILQEEIVIFSFISIKSYLFFTNKRIIMIRKNIIGTKGYNYTIIPNNSIKTIKVKQGGGFSISSYIQVFCISGNSIKLQISKTFDMKKLINFVYKSI